jgi:nucleotide-binding universal stress UspA family protein
MDGTDGSVRAAKVARSLFGEGSDYVAVSVATAEVDPAEVPWLASSPGASPARYGDVWPYVSEEGGEAASRHATHAAERAAERADVDATAVGEIGDPAEVILRVANERHVDVVVVGWHDRRWFDRLLHASVSSEVVRHADLPVLVVR